MSPFEVMEKFVANIEKERIRQNMTQAELYKAAGISASGYGKFLREKKISFENVVKLLFALGMYPNIEALLEVEEFNSLDEIRTQHNQKVRKRVRK